ncbi:TonB-dependent receptor, partial [Pseudomonas helleri]|nr:TonB-dependent receptor [Pseudomonas helleri]
MTVLHSAPATAESKDWELGFNIFKESLFFDNDRLGIKVSYFDNRIKNFSFMRYAVAMPEAPIPSLTDLSYANNLEDTRFRGVEYQLNYDMGRAYTRRRQKLSATPDLSGTVLPLCLIPNS